jgi:rod shape-determining protein MreD
VIATPAAFARTGLVLLLGVLLQVSGVAQVTVAGASPDLVPLVVGAVGFYGGAVPGAATGFLSGLLFDLALGSNLGASSLVLTGVGFLAGRFRELRDPAHGLAAMPVAAAVTAGWLLGIAAISFMLEIGASVSPLVVRDTLVTVGLNTLLAVPVFALVRRALGPALLVDVLDRRRHRAPRRQAEPIGLRGLSI